MAPNKTPNEPGPGRMSPVRGSGHSLDLIVRNRAKPIRIRAVDDLNRLARCLAPEELLGGGGPGPSKY